MADERAIAAAVKRVFHEAEHVGAQRLIDYGGNLTGYYMPADDWRRFRAHVVAAIAALPGDDAARALDEVERRIEDRLVESGYPVGVHWWPLDILREVRAARAADGAEAGR